MGREPAGPEPAGAQGATKKLWLVFIMAPGNFQLVYQQFFIASRMHLEKLPNTKVTFLWYWRPKGLTSIEFHRTSTRTIWVISFGGGTGPMENLWWTSVAYEPCPCLSAIAVSQWPRIGRCWGYTCRRFVRNDAETMKDHSSSLAHLWSQSQRLGRYI